MGTSCQNINYKALKQHEIRQLASDVMMKCEQVVKNKFIYIGYVLFVSCHSQWRTALKIDYICCSKKPEVQYGLTLTWKLKQPLEMLRCQRNIYVILLCF